MSGNERALDSPSPSSASCSNSGWKYDVFLSFRGEDTRNNFTDHLYDALKQIGIYTFRDDDRLGRGKEIASELLKAIESSRFSIVILSKNYASSTWCLEELVKIVECHMDTAKSNIFPVFYWVEPSEVRHQLGDFKTAFDKHEQDFGDNLEKVQRWRTVLTQVANLAGFTVSKDRPEARLIKEIVCEISYKLNPPFPNIPKGFVGIESRLKNIFQLLEPEPDDIRLIGICGMGGIGKSTIAKVVLNNLQHSYDGSCFLANVREVCSKDGAVALQKKLLSEVLKDTDLTIPTDLQGRMLIQRRLCRKKVFVVLDDVSDCDQLDNLAGARDWFGPGSRIVITTRDEHVLISHKIIDEIYKVEALKGKEALELFGLKAFGQIPCPPDYLQLSKEIVHHTQGLPLALDILGKHLYGKTVNQWKSALKSFEDYPNVGIMKVLRISYDGLPPNEKDIFLDIACFFKSEDEDQVKKILTSCGFHPDDGIENLIRKSLVTISGNIVSMHDLLQEMGWAIVREHGKEPGKWTRLWRPDDVHHVLTENTGTENVEGIVADMPKKGTSTCLNANSFIGMKNLMLLKISNVDLSEDLEYLPNRLRYLEWHGCPLKNLPPNFQAQKLVELNLCYSQINYLWTGRKAFEELKTIKLSHSCNLIETPDFTDVPNLAMLDLEGCRILCKVHESVGSLRLLKVLNLKNCENLESFPSNVDGMKALEILNLQGCSKLEKLPENLGELASLEELDAGRTAITQVPPSIVRLTNLQMLSFCGHRVKHNRWGTLVAAIVEFSSLGWPRRNRSFMGLSLPSLAGLSSLKKLNLSDCNLTDGALPNDLGSLCSLTQLNLSNNYFVSLPEIINQLSKLKMLCVQNCQNLKSLPELPSKLSLVRAEGCPLLEDLSSTLRGGTSPNFTLHLFNCFKLLENHGQQNNLAVMLLKQYLQQPINCTSLFDIPLPGSEIPEWFSCRSDGDSVVIGLPDNWLNDEFMGIAMCGVFLPCPDVDLNDDEDSDDGEDGEDSDDDEDGEDGEDSDDDDDDEDSDDGEDGEDSDDDEDSDDGCLDVIFQMSLISNEYNFHFRIPEGFRTMKSDILWLIYVSRLSFEHDTNSDHDSSDYIASEIAPEITYPKKEIAPVSGSTCIHASVNPIVSGFNPKQKVKKCGIRLVYKQDLEDFQELPTAEGSTFHQNHKCSLRYKRVVLPGHETCKLQCNRSITNHFQESLPGHETCKLQCNRSITNHFQESGRDELATVILNCYVDTRDKFFRRRLHGLISDVFEFHSDSD